MTKAEFENVEITRQQELVHENGTFIHTKAIGNYLYDTYRYEDFFVVFYCLIENSGEPKCHCFDNTDNIEHFINSLGRSMS